MTLRLGAFQTYREARDVKRTNLFQVNMKDPRVTKRVKKHVFLPLFPRIRITLHNKAENVPKYQVISCALQTLAEPRPGAAGIPYLDFDLPV